MGMFGFLFVMSFAAFCVTNSVLAQDQSAFISIDCGIPDGSSYEDDKTGIKYNSDASFIDTGVSRTIFLQYRTTAPLQQFQNVRSFPEGDRNCYTLRPSQAKGNKFLIRASFMYGNYDGLGASPEFDLYLGANLWDSVKTENESNIVTKEIIYLTPSDNIHVCLVNKGSGTPFISALELRLLNNNSYQTPYESLLLLRRWDLGSATNISVRYKDDIYDRIWKPLNFEVSRQLITSLTVDANNSNSFHPAGIVMATAVTPINAIVPLNLTMRDADPNSKYYFYMHFAEIEELQANQSREFNITVNNNSVYGPFTPRYLQTDTYLFTPETQAEIRFQLVRTEKSTLPPIINGLEIYIANKFLQLQTSQDDADAIMNIKSKYGVKRNWQGDPCAPQAFPWDGLNCSYDSYNPPRIVSVNLSSSGLAGQIAPFFSNLSMIQSLDLSNNSLTGAVPEFLTHLQFLRVLNLEGNKLTGSIPAELLVRSRNGLLSLRVGNNPGLCASASCQKKNKYVIPLIATIAALAVLLIGFASFWSYKRRNKQANRGIQNRPLVSENRHYTYADVVRMTNNFERVLGKGGFGTVYHGYLDNNQVAVKLLSQSSAQGYKEFRAEVELLMRVHHVNLTALVGYFHEGNHMGLIYEYMANGNLGDYLSGRHAYVLSWEERLRIASDAAQGLKYLHYGCKPPMVHRDVKPTNILLNEKMQAKLADFGLSRSFQNESRSHVSTVVAGTPGYLDPVYYAANELNAKSDVYSFGVLLLEMMTGRPVIMRWQSESTHVSDWVSSTLAANEDIKDVMDPNVRGDFDASSAWKVVELAMACVSQTSSERPSMLKVVVELNECLEREKAKLH